MKKFLKILAAFIIIAAIGVSGFAIYKSSQGISYDFTAVEKL